MTYFHVLSLVLSIPGQQENANQDDRSCHLTPVSMAAVSEGWEGWEGAGRAVLGPWEPKPVQPLREQRRASAQ